MSSLNRELCNAIRRDDLNKVKEIFSSKNLFKRPKINGTDYLGNPFLVFAAIYDKVEIVEYLIQKGANLEAQNKREETALGAAARCNSLESMQCLIKHKANINGGRVPPLLAATIEGNKEAIQLLIENNADIEIKNELGENALLYTKVPEIIEYFLKNGANIDAQNNMGETALFKAVYYNKPDNIKLLIKYGANIEVENNYGDNPLRRAALRGYLEIVQLLVKNGANINAQNQTGNTPLQSPFVNKPNNYEQVAKYLIEQGADINLCDEEIQKWAHQNATTEMAVAKINASKNITLEKIIDLSHNEPEVLKKLFITDLLLTKIKSFTYDEQLKVYKATQKILPSKRKKEFEKIIRSNRINMKRKENDRA